MRTGISVRPAHALAGLFCESVLERPMLAVETDGSRLFEFRDLGYAYTGATTTAWNTFWSSQLPPAALFHSLLLRVHAQ